LSGAASSKKAPDDAGTLNFIRSRSDQYFAIQIVAQGQVLLRNMSRDFFSSSVTPKISKYLLVAQQRVMLQRESR
jgi:hypothetical protein